MRGGEIRDPGITVFLVCQMDLRGDRKKGIMYIHRAHRRCRLRNTKTIPQLLIGVVFSLSLFPSFIRAKTLIPY